MAQRDVRHFSRRLLMWYRKNARDLPWRRTRDPYRIWISEVMLQQTTVNAVIPYYRRWVRAFPTVKKLAASNEQTVLSAWQGLGYYQRARNLHKSAGIVATRYGGRLPRDENILSGLPGFGPYTTAAVLSIAFGQPLPVVDANVRRVVMRLLCLRGEAVVARDAPVRRFLAKVFPARAAGDFNQAMMELGALVCTNRNPACLVCPVRSFCRACAAGEQELIPTVRKNPLTELHAAIAVIERNKKYCLQKRPPQGLLAGLWEFPGGKIEAGETPSAAVKREVKEELGVDVVRAEPWLRLVHFYTRYKVHLHVFRCAIAGPVRSTATRKWVSPNNLKKFPMPSGSARIAERLRGPFS